MSQLATWLREPLLHFVAIGVLLFGGYRALHPPEDARAASARIELTVDDVHQLALGWRAQGRPPPTPDELRQLVENRVREEVLYREALALGLDQGDTIVKRRLAQKMEFLFEDVAALREPAPEELRTWHAEHAADFTRPARITFGHLYFSPDHRGSAAREAAAAALHEAEGRPFESARAAVRADSFMFQDWYGDRSFDDVAKSFGPGFADALFQAPPGRWSGPLESGYGWHLVWVDAVTPAQLPPFEEVEAEVAAAWTEAQRTEIRERAYAAMRERYEVVLPAGPP